MKHPYTMKKRERESHTHTHPSTCTCNPAACYFFLSFFLQRSACVERAPLLNTPRQLPTTTTKFVSLPLKENNDYLALLRLLLSHTQVNVVCWFVCWLVGWRNKQRKEKKGLHFWILLVCGQHFPTRHALA